MEVGLFPHPAAVHSIPLQCIEGGLAVGVIAVTTAFCHVERDWACVMRPGVILV